jgi:hypothetical protein
MFKTVYLLIAAFMIFACSQGVVEEKSTEKTETPAAAQQEEAAEQPIMNPHATIPKEKQIIVPQEVSDKYKSLILGVKNEKEGIDVQTEVLIGQTAEIKGTPYSVLVENYLPDFVINGETVFTTRTAEENNPAAKIKVFEGDNMVFDGWLYKNFPDMHGSFSNPDYVLSMIKSVSK